MKSLKYETKGRYLLGLAQTHGVLLMHWHSLQNKNEIPFPCSAHGTEQWSKEMCRVAAHEWRCCVPKWSCTQVANAVCSQSAGQGCGCWLRSESIRFLQQQNQVSTAANGGPAGAVFMVTKADRRPWQPRGSVLSPVWHHVMGNVRNPL